MGKRGRKPKEQPVDPPAPLAPAPADEAPGVAESLTDGTEPRELVRHPTGDDPISEREAKAEEAPTPEPAKEPERRGFFSNVTRVET